MNNKITFKLTDKDYYQAQWIHYKLSLVKFALIILVSIWFGYFLYSTSELSILAVIGSVTAWLLWYFGYYLIYLRLRCKKIYRQQKNLSLPVEYLWDHEGIHVSNENSSGRMLWSDFVKYRENKYLFLLYQSDVMFNMLPKSAFLNEGQLNDFKECIKKINC